MAIELDGVVRARPPPHIVIHQVRACFGAGFAADSTQMGRQRSVDQRVLAALRRRRGQTAQRLPRRRGARQPLFDHGIDDASVDVEPNAAAGAGTRKVAGALGRPIGEFDDEELSIAGEVPVDVVVTVARDGEHIW